MKKSLMVLLLIVVTITGACASKQTEAPVTVESVVTEESTVAEEDAAATEEKAEKGASEEEKIAEPEIFTDKSTATMSFSFNVAGLRPEEAWTLGDNKVYFGQFEGNPVVYRVLPPSQDTQTIEANQECLFLDCDSVLLAKEYDADNKKNDGQTKRQNEWRGSDLEAWLNGDEFYGNSDMFSEMERNAIVSTELAEKSEAYSTGKWTYQDFGTINYIFMLSAAEANQLYVDNAERAKTGSNISWWLRSSFAEAGQGAGAIHADGHLCNNSVKNFSNGVCPAMNVNMDSILFVSTIGTGNAEETNTSVEWKMTLLDNEKTIQVADGQAVTRTDTDAGIVITVPYTYTGIDVTQISVMITDKEYKEEGAQVLFYGALHGVETDSRSGTGTCTLPSDLKEQTCGTDYYAYIFAEDVNADKRTDYASEPHPIAISKISEVMN